MLAAERPRTVNKRKHRLAEPRDATALTPLVGTHARVKSAGGLRPAPGPATSAARVLALQRAIGNRGVVGLLQRQPKPNTREDVVVIVGRASHTTEKEESVAQKDEMAAWRATAKNLAPDGRVFEGLTVDAAFKGVGKLTTPIGRLYIIGHGDPAGIEEIDAKTGGSRSATMEDVTKRMKAAIGDLKDRAPQSVEILYCSAGGSPKALAQIGAATGAQKVHAPIQETVIGHYTFTVNGKRLTAADMRNQSDTQLRSYIGQTDAMKYYDFIAGVPHPDTGPSNAEKMTALIAVLRKTGTIPHVSYNAMPGQRNAVPIWKADVTKRSASEDELPTEDTIGATGVIEVDVAPGKAAPKEKPKVPARR